MISGGDFSSIGYSGQPTDSNGPQPLGGQVSLGVNLAPSITANLLSDKIPDKIVGIKTLLAVMSKGEDVSEFFQYVVQEITSPDETLRHLSYVYIVHYAECQRENALMAVNTFKQNISDRDPILCTYALKVLVSLRSTELLDIIIEAVETCSHHLSPYVRKAAALAIIKVYETDEEGKYKDKLMTILQQLLNDQSVIPIGGAVYVIDKMVSDRDDLLHPLFRTLCTAISRMDPWAQTTTLHLLLRYSRRNLKRPSGTDITDDDDDEIDPDLDLLIRHAQPLLCSITPSVTLAAAKIFVYLAPSYKLPLIVKPLIRFTYMEPPTAYAALSAISCIITQYSDLFVPHHRHFFIYEADAKPVKLLKINILGQLARSSNADLLIRELTNFVQCGDQDIATAAVYSIGRAANASGDSATTSFSYLFRLLDSPTLTVQAEAMKMLCLLIKPLPKPPSEFNEFSPEPSGDTEADEAEIRQNLIKLLGYFGKIDDADAKAAMISLMGDKVSLIPLQAHEMLRQLAVNFTMYPVPVKIQTLTLAAKVFVKRGKEAAQLVQYVFSVGSHDSDIGVRDTARLYHNLLSKKTDAQAINDIRHNADEFLFTKKPVPVFGGDILGPEVVELDTISQLINEFLSPKSKMVPWADPDKLPNPSVRSQQAGPLDETYEKEEQRDEDEDSDNMDTFLFGSAKPEFTSPVPQKEEEEDDVDVDSFLAGV